MKAFLSDQTRISQVHLRTAKLESAVAFYTDVLGLTLLHAPGSQAILSATGEGPELLELTEDLNAPLRPPRSTGLFHFAIRYPTRPRPRLRAASAKRVSNPRRFGPPSERSNLSQ